MKNIWICLALIVVSIPLGAGGCSTEEEASGLVPTSIGPRGIVPASLTCPPETPSFPYLLGTVSMNVQQLGVRNGHVLVKQAFARLLTDPMPDIAVVPRGIGSFSPAAPMRAGDMIPHELDAVRGDGSTIVLELYAMSEAALTSDPRSLDVEQWVSGNRSATPFRPLEESIIEFTGSSFVYDDRTEMGRYLFMVCQADRPPASEVVFSSNRDGDNEIYVTLLDGTNFQLTDNDALDMAPAWSPSRAGIAFASDRNDPGGLPTIWTMNADGTNQQILTTLGSVQPVFLTQPVWSPDGTRIAYVELGTTAPFTNALRIVSATGGTAIARYETTGGLSGMDWGNVGGNERIVFAQSGALLEMDPDTSDAPVELLNNPTEFDALPATLSNGEVLFMRSSEAGYGIYRRRTDGTVVAVVTDATLPSGLGIDEFHAENDDPSARIVIGTSIFNTTTNQTESRLRTINPDGSNLTEIPGQTGNNFAPDW